MMYASVAIVCPTSAANNYGNTRTAVVYGQYWRADEYRIIFTLGQWHKHYNVDPIFVVTLFFINRQYLILTQGVTSDNVDTCYIMVYN